MVYKIISLRAPKGSSGDSLLLWALESAPSLEQIPGDLEPGWGGAAQLHPAAWGLLIAESLVAVATR